MTFALTFVILSSIVLTAFALLRLGLGLLVWLAPRLRRQ